MSDHLEVIQALETVGSALRALQTSEKSASAPSTFSRGTSDAKKTICMGIIKQASYAYYLDQMQAEGG
jgi:hypothetical protein